MWRAHWYTMSICHMSDHDLYMRVLYVLHLIIYSIYIYMYIYIIIHIYTAYIHNYCVQLMYNVIYITELNSTYPTAVPPPILGRKPWLSFQPQPQQEQSRSGTDVHPGPWPMEDLGAFGFVQNRVSSKKNMGP